MPKYEAEAMTIAMFIQDVFKLGGHKCLAGKALQLDEQIKMMLKDACVLRANVRELEAKIPGHRPIIFADYPPYQRHIQDLEDEYLVLEHEAEAIRAACCSWRRSSLLAMPPWPGRCCSPGTGWVG